MLAALDGGRRPRAVETRLERRYRSGDWKLVDGSDSCAVARCGGPLLFDLSTDLNETRDLSGDRPDLVEEMLRNFSEWVASVSASRADEARCPAPAPAPTPAGGF